MVVLCTMEFESQDRKVILDVLFAEQSHIGSQETTAALRLLFYNSITKLQCGDISIEQFSGSGNETLTHTHFLCLATSKAILTAYKKAIWACF